MSLFQRIISAGLLYATITSATNLYVASSDGNLTTLSLERTDGEIFLKAPFVSTECSDTPSWLSLDPANRVLYCLDRGNDTAVNGSINSFSIGAAGNLTRIDRVDAPGSGVHMTFFGTEAKKQGIASVSYNKSAAAVFGIENGGNISDTSLQNIFPTLDTPGPVTKRQSLSYLHQVNLDPTGKYLFMNDLGGDMVRIFTWDAANLAPLKEIEPLKTDPGVGPRHSKFWKSPSNNSTWYYIFVGELSQKVHSYKLNYAATGVTWTKVSELFALGKESLPEQAPTSGIDLSPDNKFVIVSNRENSFGKLPVASDSMSVLSIGNNGTLSLIQVTPSGGWSPRHFSINKAGDMIAVGHQKNSTVVIWKRDVESGKILTGPNGESAGVIKLSGSIVCTIWDEK